MATGQQREVVLVPVNGTAYDTRAIDLGIVLSGQGHADVLAIFVVVVPQELPLEAEMADEVARGEEVLRQAEDYALTHGYDIEVELLQARTAGAAIVDEAIERHASMIVLATSIWRRAGEITIGRTTVPYVLKNAPCEVIVCRRPGGDKARETR